MHNPHRRRMPPLWQGHGEGIVSGLLCRGAGRKYIDGRSRSFHPPLDGVRARDSAPGQHEVGDAQEGEVALLGRAKVDGDLPLGVAGAGRVQERGVGPGGRLDILLDALPAVTECWTMSDGNS